MNIKSTFRAWCNRCDAILSRSENERNESVIFTQDESNVTRKVEPALVQRRNANYLQALAYARPLLSTTLCCHPYDMPEALLGKLKAVHDIQSVVRRLTPEGIHFDSKC